jgi:DNA-binding NarL/FixJ family response regulator
MKVLVVEDQRLFADAVAATLRSHGAETVEVVGTGDEALASLEGAAHDVVLLDIGLPDRSGLSLGREIVERHPQVRVIAVTAIDDTRLAREAIRAGFHGYLTKDVRVSEFMSAIQAVLAGQVVMPSPLARRVASPRRDDIALLVHQLTPRELDVLRLLAQGKTSEDLAVELGIRRNTVRTHVQSILAKLQVHSRLEAAAFAVRHGVVDSADLRRALRPAI